MNTMRYISLFFLFCCGILRAQPGPNAVWHFGKHCNLSFNTGSPVPAVWSALDSDEGSAVYSNAQGQVKLYTDGVKVYNANNTVIQNGTGLLGSTTSAQSAVIIPFVNDTGFAYVFTSDQGGYMPGLLNLGVHYSVVQFNNSNVGAAVILKNKLLAAPPMTEKLAAIKQCNNKDYWVLCHRYNSNEFLAYSITASGLDTIPVVSATGLMLADSPPRDSATSIGFIKFSHDGSRLACTDWAMNMVEVFDFDRSTGLVSNPLSFSLAQYCNTNNYYEGAYGVEFSPDDSKLYVSICRVTQQPGARILQYDLNAGSAAAIIASETPVANATYSIGDMITGPDGKIYCTHYNSHELDRIDAPNLPGAACAFTPSAVVFANNQFVNLGLPNLVRETAPYPQPVPLADVFLCEGKGELTAAAGTSQWHWSTGDSSQQITVAQTGVYMLHGNYAGCSFDDTAAVLLSLDGNFNAPNVFTPNGDGVNDVFETGNPREENYLLEIFNRWGERVFQSYTPLSRWDGKLNGMDVPDGVYFWTARFTDCQGDRREQGTVSLLR